MRKQKYSISNRYIHIIVLLGAVVGAGWMWFTLTHSHPTHLTINEVSFNNNNGNDWVELYNPSLNSVSLKGYYLSDSDRKLTKFEIFDDVVLPRHGYLVLYGENHDAVPTGTMQLSFNVANGETLYLTASDGVTIVDRLTVVGDEGRAVGRFPDGADETFTFSTSTPGARNIKDRLDELIELLP